MTQDQLPQSLDSRKKRRVFLSYADQDRERVLEIYERLRSDGFEPWMESKDLTSKDHREQEIKNVIRQSGIVVVCLSRNTIAANVIRKQVKIAIETEEEQPAGTIFLIPNRLEECNIPGELQHLPCNDYFEKDGYEELVSFLDQRFGVIKQVGETIGEYKITGVLGQGGMGKVYRCQHQATGEDVAIKVMHAGNASDPGFAQRFRREAKAARALNNHEHIVAIHDYDYSNQFQSFYIVMELVPDGSLDTLLAQRPNKPYSVKYFGELIRQAADALHFSHQQGIIHRDVKPENMLLKRMNKSYTLKMSDFGLAQMVSGSTLTTVGSMKGTPLYTAPEQFTEEGRKETRSDIYALGIILYDIATGYLPFQIERFLDASRHHTYAEPPLPRTLNPQLPEAFETIILRCLAKKPQHRFSTALELLDALNEVLQDPVLGSIYPQSPMSSSRHRSSVYTRYERGIERLLARLPTHNPRYQDALSFESQLQENIRVSRRYRDTLDSEVRRQQILDNLNALSQSELGVSFNKLCDQTYAHSIHLHITLQDANIPPVTPGEPASITLVLSNRGTRERPLKLELEGKPASWISGPESSIELKPIDTIEVPLTIHVPRTPDIKPGDYSLTIRVRSQAQEDKETASLQTTVQIKPFVETSLTITPLEAEGYTEAAYVLTLRNNGNIEIPCTLYGESKDASLTYSFAKNLLSPKPGTVEEATMTVCSSHQHLSPGRYQFAIGAQPEGEYQPSYARPFWLVPPRRDSHLTTIEPETVNDEQATFTLTIQNKGNVCLQYNYEVQELPAPHLEYTFSPPSITLEPFQEPAEIVLDVRAGEQPLAAGMYKIVVTVHSSDEAGVETPLAPVQATWTVEASVETTLEIKPEEVVEKESAKFTVQIHNQGDIPLDYILSELFKENDNSLLDYHFGQTSLYLPSGDSKDINLEVRSKQQAKMYTGWYYVAVQAQRKHYNSYPCVGFARWFVPPTVHCEIEVDKGSWYKNPKVYSFTLHNDELIPVYYELSIKPDEQILSHKFEPDAVIIYPGKSKEVKLSVELKRQWFVREGHNVQISYSSKPVTDEYSHYELAMDKLLNEMGHSHPKFSNILTYEQRLKENIRKSRCHGDNETRRTERSEIISHLNDDTGNILGKTFNKLADEEAIALSKPYPPRHKTYIDDSQEIDLDVAHPSYFPISLDQLPPSLVLSLVLVIMIASIISFPFISDILNNGITSASATPTASQLASPASTEEITIFPPTSTSTPVETSVSPSPQVLSHLPITPTRELTSSEILLVAEDSESQQLIFGITRNGMLERNSLQTTGQSPSLSNDGSHVAFIRQDKDNPNTSQIWRVDVDGTNLRQITNLSEGDAAMVDETFAPSWSSHNKWILFAAESTASVTDVLMLVNALDEDDTPEPTQLAMAGNVQSVTWSPDSRQFLVGVGQNGSYRVYRVDVAEDGTMSQSELSLPADSVSEIWSPAWYDDTQFAVISPEGIYTGRLSEKDVTWQTEPITISNEWEFVRPPYASLQWSPDGDRFAFTVASIQDDESRAQLLVKEIGEKTTGTRLTIYGCWNYEWSPDGKGIAYVRGKEGRERATLEIMTVDNDDYETWTIEQPDILSLLWKNEGEQNEP